MLGPTDTIIVSVYFPAHYLLDTLIKRKNYRRPDRDVHVEAAFQLNKEEVILSCNQNGHIGSVRNLSAYAPHK
jgi:hypothetical protein